MLIPRSSLSCDINVSMTICMLTSVRAGSFTPCPGFGALYTTSPPHRGLRKALFNDLSPEKQMQKKINLHHVANLKLKE